MRQQPDALRRPPVPLWRTRVALPHLSDGASIVASLPIRGPTDKAGPDQRTIRGSAERHSRPCPGKRIHTPWVRSHLGLPTVALGATRLLRRRPKGGGATWAGPSTPFPYPAISAATSPTAHTPFAARYPRRSTPNTSSRHLLDLNSHYHAHLHFHDSPPPPRPPGPTGGGPIKLPREYFRDADFLAAGLDDPEERVPVLDPDDRGNSLRNSCPQGFRGGLRSPDF
jgi:hypothetical protein